MWVELCIFVEEFVMNKTRFCFRFALAAIALCLFILQAPSALAASGGDWWHPHPGTKWAIQYAGKIDTSLDVAAYDIDLVDTDQAVIDALRSKGKKVICYFR